MLLQHSSPYTLLPTRAHTRTWRSPVAGALTINVGDMLQVYSNDRYVAPLHRVLANRDKHRYSAPFFFNPVSLLLPLALLACRAATATCLPPAPLAHACLACRL